MIENFEKQLDSQKRRHNLGVRKVLCRSCNLIFPKAHLKHWQSNKNLRHTGQKYSCDKYQLIYDRNTGQKISCYKCRIFYEKNQQQNCRKVDWEIGNTYFYFLCKRKHENT